jgi:hypothetical protein
MREEMVRLGVELLPALFVGLVLPPTGTEAPEHPLNKRSHDRTVVKATQWEKSVPLAYFCAEQGKRQNIYSPLQWGLRGRLKAESLVGIIEL